MNNDVVNAINAYYKEVGLAEYYADRADESQNPISLQVNEDLAAQHFHTAIETKDYILMRFKEDLEEAPGNIKELYND